MRGPDRPPVDLSGLNEGERTALDLLAQGHTAKSIATLTGRSVDAVNERLREARRKTGIGSSRELARLLRAQENRDEKMGMATAAASGAATMPTAAVIDAGGPIRKGLIAVTIIATAVIAATLLLQTTSQTIAPDPLLDSVVPTSAVEPNALRTQVRSEQRDTDWAPRAEAMLASRYATIRDIDPVRVICARTLCEVAGVVTVTASLADKSNAVRNLQMSPLTDDLRKLGFTSATMAFGSSRDNPKRTGFAAYWVRND